MKTTNGWLSVLAVIGLVLGAGSARAATMYWDTVTNANVQGGTGVWSTANAFWSTNTSCSTGPFAWTDWDDAIFSAAFTNPVTGGGVIVNGPFANSLRFSATGRLLPGSGPLTL